MKKHTWICLVAATLPACTFDCTNDTPATDTTIRPPDDVRVDDTAGAGDADGTVTPGDDATDDDTTNADATIVTTPPRSQDKAVAALEAASTVPVEVSTTHGQPRTVTMRVPLPAGANAIAQVLTYFEQHKDVYGFTDVTHELIPVRRFDDAGRTRIAFQQYRFGIPVFGARIGAHVHDGHIVMTAGAWSTRRTGVSGATMSPEAARTAAVAAATDGDEVTILSQPRLVWYDPALNSDWSWLPAARNDVPPGPPVLAWQMRLLKSRMPHLVHIQAHTGALLSLESENHTIDWDIDNADNDWSDTCWFMTWDDNNWYTEDGPTGYPGPSQDAYLDGKEAQDTIGTIYDWFRNRFGWKSYDNDDEDIYIIVHVGDAENETGNWRNASFTRGCDQIQMGDSYGTFDILTHEYVHGIITNTSDLIYQNTSGAINESMADVFAGYVTNDWMLGETTELMSRPRDLWFPANSGQPDHLDNYLRTEADHGGVHFNSGIPTRAAAILAHADARANLQWPMPGLSPQDTSCLLFVVMVHVLQPNSNFFDLADAMLGAVRNGECNVPPTPANQCAVINAYASVGLRDPDVQCDGVRNDGAAQEFDADTIPDAIDNCRYVSNRTQLDTDRDGIGDACDPDLDNDGVPNDVDNCIDVPNANQTNTNQLPEGDVCEDTDGDGVVYAHDNCPDVANPAQYNLDGDMHGDACDVDIDGDLVSNPSDNCPRVANPEVNGRQADGDNDGVGDACDNCPSAANNDQVDCDGDGIGAACTGTTGDAARNERICELVRETEHLGVGLQATLPPDARIRLPSCIQCDAWLDPTQSIRLTIAGVSVGDIFVVEDQQGHVVARSRIAAVANVDVVLDYTPGFAIWHMAGDAGAVTARTFTLRRIGPAVDVGKITVTAGVSN